MLNISYAKYESYQLIQIHEESHSDDIFTTSQPSMSPVHSNGLIDSLTTFNPTSDMVNFTDIHSNEQFFSKSEPKHTLERMIQDVRKSESMDSLIVSRLEHPVIPLDSDDEEYGTSALLFQIGVTIVGGIVLWKLVIHFRSRHNR